MNRPIYDRSNLITRCSHGPVGRPTAGPSNLHNQPRVRRRDGFVLRRRVATGLFTPMQRSSCKSVAVVGYVPLRFGIVMRLSILRAADLFFSLPACAFAGSNVM